MFQNKPVLSIVIVSWNVRDDISNCLKSIFSNKPAFSSEVIVVDNASSDGTVSFIKENFPEVITISNNRNLGFAAANNEGIKRAGGDFVFLLNPDTIVKPEVLNTLVNYLREHGDVGAVGPLLLNEDGTVQNSVRRFPTFRGALYRHTAFRYFKVFKGAYKSWMMKDFDYSKQANVEQLMGAAILLRREVLEKTGAFDERYFMYYEDVDLCYRIRQAGWQIVFSPQTSIIHLGGRSSGQMPLRIKIMAAGSLLRFFSKYRGRAVTACFAVIFIPLMFVRESIELTISLIKTLFRGG